MDRILYFFLLVTKVCSFEKKFTQALCGFCVFGSDRSNHFAGKNIDYVFEMLEVQFSRSSHIIKNSSLITGQIQTREVVFPLLPFAIRITFLDGSFFDNSEGKAYQLHDFVFETIMTRQRNPRIRIYPCHALNLPI